MNLLGHFEQAAAEWHDFAAERPEGDVECIVADVQELLADCVESPAQSVEKLAEIGDFIHALLMDPVQAGVIADGGVDVLRRLPGKPPLA